MVVNILNLFVKGLPKDLKWVVKSCEMGNKTERGNLNKMKLVVEEI